MNNRKGFSLVELLATVTILGIIAVIGITAVTALINRAHDEYYRSQEKNLILAAQAYYNANKTKLPKVVGKKSEVTAYELKEAKYLKKEITKYDGKPCKDGDDKKTKVVVFKAGGTTYNYTAYLNCQPDKSASEAQKNGSPSIDIDFSTDKNNLKMANAIIHITGGKDSSNQTIKLMSYSYEISVKKGDKFVELTKSYDNKLSGSDVTKTIDLSKFTLSGNAKVRVKVTATNAFGNSTTYIEISNYTDNKDPKCEIDNADLVNDPRGFKNYKEGTRKIKIKCNDDNGSGCEKDTYTKTFSGDTINGTIKIKDNVGRTATCNVSVYLDNTAPTLEVNIYEADSNGNKKNNTVLATAKVTTDKETKTIKGSDIKGNTNGWLNKSVYPYGIIISVKATDTVAIKEYEYKENTEGLTTSATNLNILTSKDKKTYPVKELIENNKSNIVKSYTNDYLIKDEGARRTKITLEDGFGHTGTINIEANIDRTSPTCGTKTNDSTTWTKDDRTISVKCNDTGTSNCKQESFSKKYNKSTQTANITISDNAENTTSCSVNVYIDKCDQYDSDWTYGACRCDGDQQKTGTKKSTRGSGFVCKSTETDCSSTCCGPITIKAKSKTDPPPSCWDCQCGEHEYKNNSYGAHLCQKAEVHFIIGGCKTKLSGYVCYYQPRFKEENRIQCSYAKRVYKLGDHGLLEPHAAGHACFDTENDWYYYRSTEEAYAKACNQVGGKDKCEQKHAAT